VTEEGSGARVVRNTLANGAGTFVGVLVSLVLTPFLINGLGTEAFGVWALALSISVLGGYASMTDLGVETSVARYVAEARADGDERAAREVVSTAMAFFVVVALVVAPLLAALSFPLVAVFDIPARLHGEAVLCFVLIASQLLIELPARVFYAVLEGAQRFEAYQVIEVVRAVSQAGLFAVVLVADLGVAGLGGAMVVSSAIVLVTGWACARRMVPEARVSRSDISRSRLRTLVTFGGQYFFVRLAGTIYRQMDKAIVGIALGVAMVTFYEVANRIHQAASMVQSIAASALLPTTAYLRAHKEVLRDLYLRGTTYAVAISLPFVGAGFIFAQDLIRTWIGPSLEPAAGSARLFLTFLVLASVHSVGSVMLVALGRMRFVIKLLIVFTAVNLAVSIALVGPLGVDGVILGTVVAQAVIWVPYTVKFLREFEVSLREWLARVVVPNLPGVVAQAATAYPLLWLADRSSNLLEVAGAAFVSVLASLAAFLTIGLRAQDRAQLFGVLRRALRMHEGAGEPTA
jgi:O-antigen/teichoic acid export membrane protein